MSRLGDIATTTVCLFVLTTAALAELPSADRVRQATGVTSGLAVVLGTTDGKRVYFGSHDGCVYAVHVSDGTLAWRFLAAPADKRMVAFGQVESSWPIFNVVLENGKLYCCAGRHQDIDGGLHFWCLDAATGNAVWHSRYKSGLPTQNEIDQLNNSPRTLVPTTYGMNNELTIEGDKLVLHGESCMPLRLDKNGFDDVVMNPDSLVPPECKD